MSSGTRYESDAGRKIIGATSDKILDPLILDKIARLGMSPRQQMLNHLWSIYRCAQYDARKVGWDGSEHIEGIEAEAIASAGFLPPGFYSAGAMFPLKFRKPNVTYSLAKVIVDRFTGLLFSEKRHPFFRVDGDPLTEDFVTALAESARLWQTAILARTMGGAMGTVAMGFQFVNGKPLVEVHDTRWCTPTFSDPINFELSSLEIRYMKEEEMRDPQTGVWGFENFWYRRVITDTQDIVYEPEPVGDGMEPLWAVDAQKSVTHNFGFVPVVWVQNLPVLDDIDGDPDCHGTYETIAAVDALLSQANKGVLANCDPTPVLKEDQDISQLSKGSDNAIKVTKGGDFTYAELIGTGPKAARELAAELRGIVLEVAQCVLDHAMSTTAKTATEIERTYSSMLSKADILREQYGQRGFLPLMEKMVRAVRQLSKPKVDSTGTQLIREVVILPSRYEKTAKGVKAMARQLGPGGVLKLQWGPYFAPTLTDAREATQAAVAARAGDVLDDEHAIKFVAPFFGVEDANAMREKIRIAGGGALDVDALMERSMQEQKASPATEQTHFYQYEIEGGIFTINEVRASKGLGPMPDGDLSVPQYRAKYNKIFAGSTVTQAATSAEQILGMNDSADTGEPDVE